MHFLRWFKDWIAKRKIKYIFCPCKALRRAPSSNICLIQEPFCMISLIECEMVIGLIHNLQFELLIKGDELN
jgi:hypothetical protein